MTGKAPHPFKGVPRPQRAFALVYSYHQLAPRLLALLQAFPTESFYVQDLTKLLDADLRTEDAVRTISGGSVSNALKQLIKDRAVTYRLETKDEEALRVKYSEQHSASNVLYAAKLYSVTSPVPARDSETVFATYAQLPAARTFLETHPGLPRKASLWGPDRAADYLAGRAFTTPAADQPELPATATAPAPAAPAPPVDAAAELAAAVEHAVALAHRVGAAGANAHVADLEAQVADLEQRLIKSHAAKEVLKKANHDLEERLAVINKALGR